MKTGLTKRLAEGQVPRRSKNASATLNNMQSKLVVTQEDLLGIALAGQAGRVQTVNLHHLSLASTSETFRPCIEQADYVTADGWPVAWALSRGDKQVPRITGADFVEDLAKKAPAGLRIALLGASTETGNAFEKMMNLQGVSVPFREHGRAVDWDISDIVLRAGREKCTLMLIAVTPPLGDELGLKVVDHGFAGMVIPVGGAVDMVTGFKIRANTLLQHVGMEWLFRLIQEPRRLYNRYLLQCLPVLLLSIVPWKISKILRLNSDKETL